MQTHESAGASAPAGRHQRRRDALLATVAHELRNGIAPLGNALEVLAGSDDASARALAVALARRQLRAMAHLVEDLADYGQASRGRSALERHPLELQELLTQSIQACRSAFDERAVELAVALPAAPLTVSGDELRLGQVFMNLLTNAAKFAAPGGRVAVCAGRDGGMAEVRIADDGAGIEAHDLERIFELFEQGGGSRQLSPRGLGVGLAVARRFAQLHGGSVRAESRGAGQGSTFIVRLPLVPCAPAGDQCEPLACGPLSPVSC
ncbi:HAMP domain-containing histidine kinase [Ramlibacter sp. RBP-2]|uniref:histidine kinase n=1 Tax=Ramlibacter lithotrophicus TaxID=2606681 RepID=A0A7X6DE74_9BURK|nr:HAMP domain-containing sensor histidine kinase [Ramlibacter lithotrophicus]NKE65482.1 HAMP domain-containing histidine kinase [Ramlibacter lithotrophicus]